MFQKIKWIDELIDENGLWNWYNDPIEAAAVV